MVYTERAPRRQQLPAAPAMQQPNGAVSTPLGWILKKRAMKGYSNSLRIPRDKSAVGPLESGEQCYVEATNNVMPTCEPVWPGGKALGW